MRQACISIETCTHSNTSTLPYVKVIEVLESKKAKSARQLFYLDNTVLIDSKLGCALGNTKSNQFSPRMRFPDKDYTPVAVCCNGTMLCAVNTSMGMVLVYDLASSKLLEEFSMQVPDELLPFDGPCFMSSHQTSSVIALGLQYSNTVCLVDITSHDKHSSIVLEAIVPNCEDDVFVKGELSATHLAVITDFGRLLVFRLNLQQAQMLPVISTAKVTCCRFSPNSRNLFVSTRQGNSIWSVAARVESHVLQRPAAIEDRECQVAEFSPNGQIVAASCDSAIYLWEAEFGHYLGALCDAEQTIVSIAFSWNSQRLLALCRDDSEEDEEEALECTQIVWDLLSGQRDRIRILSLHPELSGLPALLARIQAYLF